MSTSQNEMSMEVVIARLAELEEANTRMQDELAAIRSSKPTVSHQNTLPTRQAASAPLKSSNRSKKGERRKSRRGVLRNGLGMAAALGAAAFMELGTLPASAHSSQQHIVSPDDHVGNFSSSKKSVPAVTATGANGATGVNASSDYGTGINGTSDFGYGISAISTNNFGLQAASTSSHAIFAQSQGGDALHAIGGGSSVDSAVFASGGGGYGLYAQSNGGTAVYAENFNGTGIFAKGSNGAALVVQGTVQVQGNAVGVANLPAGQTSVTVSTSAATPSSNIVLTALTFYHGSLWVTRSSGSFTINVSVSQSNNVSFSYLIIN